jgi:hypothetical protein
MSPQSTRRRFIAVASSSAAVGLAGCLGGGDDNSSADNTGSAGEDSSSTDIGADVDADGETTFLIRIENVAPTDFYGSDTATGGQVWLTPGAYAVHEGENPIFSTGEPASVGLEALAEAGPPTGFEGDPGLVDELPNATGVSSVGAFTPANTVEDPNDPMGEVPGAPPIAPGGAYEFEIQAAPGDRLSFASMYVPSNDLFVSPDPAIRLFEEGEPVSGDVTDTVGLFDAGTELNGEPGIDTAGAPLQGQNGGATVGPTEGVVHPADRVNDGFRYAQPSDIVNVRLTSDGDSQFMLRIENVAPTDFYGDDTATGGQIWITPGAFAVHEGENPIFSVGDTASVGLEALAEAGPPTGFPDQPGLVDELPEVNRVSSVGAFTPADTVEDPNDPMGEVPGAPPIAPGGAFEISFEAVPSDRLSFASMYVPSNDLFLSPRPAIQLYEGGEPVSGDVTETIGLFDAGTELNGEPGVDIAGAPLQGQNGGPTAGPTEGVVHPADRVNDEFMYADTMNFIQVTLTPQ